MKRSTSVMLVLSGSLLGGCGQQPTYSPGITANSQSEPDGLVTSEAFGDFGATNAPAITNNTYVAERGYYHAPYRAWYPFPYNHFVPGIGYYHGGRYTPATNSSPIQASRPVTSRSSISANSASRSSKSSSVTRGGFTRSGSSYSSASS